MLGILLLLMGFVLMVGVPLQEFSMSVFQFLTLNWAPSLVRGVPFLLIGLLGSAFAVYKILDLISRGNRMAHGHGGAIAKLHQQKKLAAGPRFVAIGGGTGLPILLRGLKHYTSNITAIVATTDDGGSSGRLREEMGIPPPGDARSCLAALAEEESLMDELLRYRFSSGMSLSGHNLGNLILAALSDVQNDFQEALDVLAKLVGLRGRVVPVSVEGSLVLRATTEDHATLNGESAIGQTSSPIRHIWMEPRDASVNPLAIQAIRDADFIVIGPGSLLTSVVPNFLVEGITEAVNSAFAPKLFVCNIATQKGETQDFNAKDHLEAFFQFAGVQVSHVLFNDNLADLDEALGQIPVEPVLELAGFDCQVILADLLDKNILTHHDPDKVGLAVIRIHASILNKKRSSSSIPPVA